MQLLVVRHARAKDRDKFAATGKPDAKRPLTGEGIRRMKKAARGFRSLVPSIGLLVSSSLVRAVETAHIIADEYGGLDIVERRELAPGQSANELIDYLASKMQRDERDEPRPACIVGHEPDLSDLIELLLADASEAPKSLKKGSATLIEFQGSITAGAGRLRWHRTAKELASEAR